MAEATMPARERPDGEAGVVSPVSKERVKRRPRTQQSASGEAAPAAKPENKWASLSKHAFKILWDEEAKPQALRWIRAKVAAHIWGRKSPKVEAAPSVQTKDRIQARLIVSMIDWRLTGTFKVPFRSGLEAKLQYWDTEWLCPLTGYQIEFLRAAHEKFPDTRSFAAFLTVFETLDPSARARMLERRKASVQIVQTPGAKVTIVGFSGIRHSCLGIGWPTFYRAVAAKAGANLVILKDYNMRLFMAGVRNFGDKQKTVEGLRKLMAKPELAGTEFVFLGASGGTFGALSYAGLLGVKRVVGLSGPCSIEVGLSNEDRYIYPAILAEIEAGKLEHEDPTKRVREGGVERVDYFVAGQNEFDQQQCRHLLENTSCTIQHVYPTSEHMITDYCIADGRLVAAIKGEKLEPLLL